MRLIIGGSYQGKLDFAVKNYDISKDKIADGDIFDFSRILEINCINNYHLLVKKCVQNGENAFDLTDEILGKNPDIIIIMNEVGNGIVPIEKSERLYREQVGKVGCLLAEKAETVERIVCGFAVKIKG